MAGRRFCLLDRNRMGPLLALSETAVECTTVDACDVQRTILGDVAAMAGIYHFEVYVWSQSLGDLSNLFWFGVAPTDAPLSGSVSNAPVSVAYSPGLGEIWQDGALFDNVQQQAERTCLGLRLELTPGASTVTFYVQGAPVMVVPIADGYRWLPAFSIGSDTPADVSLWVNFGQSRFDCFDATAGWSVKRAGVDTLYLSVASEAFMASAASGEIAAGQPFEPAMLNTSSMSVKCEPLPWFHRTSAERTPSSVCVMRGNNARGAFNDLLGADVRDAVVKVRRLDAPAGAVGSPAGATVEMTGYLDSKSAPKPQEAEVRIRGALARLDGPLRTRVIPPFYDEGAAGRIWPVGIGVRRLVSPLVLDQAKLLYALGDEVQTNVALVTDGGAPLDANAAPPQYTPALGGRAMALDTDPEFRVSVDCSSIGPQVPAPGVPDVLGGDGAFGTWTAGVPNGWTLPTNPPFPPAVVSGGSIAQVALSGGRKALRITSGVPYKPTGTGYYYGFPVTSAATPLYPGVSYRITVTVTRSLGGANEIPAPKWGFAMLSAFKDSAAYWITPYKEPINVPLGTTGETYTFTYTVPRSETAPLPLILSCISKVDTPSLSYSALVEVTGIVVEELGRYEEAPAIGTTLRETLAEILVLRQREDPAIYSEADAQALDDATGIQIGLHYDDTPNVLDMLIEAVDNWGGVLFEDADGVIRIRRLTPPEEGDDPIVAVFDDVPLDDFAIVDDLAPGLTTNWGFRPNCAPFSGGDFVTDTVTVPVGLRAQYQQPCQFYRSGSVPIATLYDAARMRARKIFRIDDTEKGTAEGNRVLGMFARNRRVVRFRQYMRADGTIGSGPSIAPRDLLYADKCTITVPSRGLVQQKIRIVSKETFLGDSDRKVILKGWF